MPLWTIHYSPGTISEWDRKMLAKSITGIYRHYNLPDFYVNVIFKEASPNSLFIGEDAHPRFAIIVISHVAGAKGVNMDQSLFLQRVDEVLNPFMTANEMDWEYHVTSGYRDLWKINGIVPPPSGSEGEKLWAKLNKPVVAKL